jgi:CBS domain-containing protein
MHMKLREIMSNQVVRIHPEESVAVAARTLTHYNIGILPVMGNDGRIVGLVTDRDIVTRCLAAGKAPEQTAVAEVMTRKIIAARPDMEASIAASMMGAKQIRRLPVMENGKLCGMVSLADLARSEESCMEAGDALSEISSNVSRG